MPVVLHHGLGFADFQIGPWRHRYFRGIGDLIARQFPVIQTRVHPTAGIARRAQQLKDTILEQLKEMVGGSVRRVVIVGHSMGGLDARYMINRLGMEDRVAALVTVTTPHRGSPYADWCLKHLGRRLGGLKLAQMLGADIGALTDLTTESCLRFNEEIQDVPGVRYYSVSAARPWHKIPPMAFHSYKVVRKAEGPNDGLVSVQSSSWANHLCTWSADHWHTINRRMVPEFRNRTGNIAPYYVRMLQRVNAEAAIAC